MHLQKPFFAPHTVVSKVILILPGAIRSWPCPTVVVYQGKRVVYNSKTMASSDETVRAIALPEGLGLRALTRVHHVGRLRASDAVGVHGRAVDQPEGARQW